MAYEMCGVRAAPPTIVKDGKTVSITPGFATGLQQITFSTSSTNRLCLLTVSALNYSTVEGDITEPTSPSLTWTRADRRALGSVDVRFYWAWASSTLASETVSVTLTGNKDFTMQVSCYSGSVDLGGYTKNVNYLVASTSSTSTTPSITATTLTNGSLLYSTGLHGDPSKIEYVIPSSGYLFEFYGTQISSGNFWVTVSASYLPPASQTTGVSAFSNSQNWAIVVLEILAA